MDVKGAGQDLASILFNRFGAKLYAMSIRATIAGVTALLGLGLSVQALPQDNVQTREQVWLIAHNAERAEFGVPALRWSDALEREARDWAETLARDEVMRHSSYQERKGTGENLWMGTAGYYRAEQMIAHFAAEKQYFAPGRFPQVSRTGDWSDVGHFTQIVWADTREVGCAMARGARYDFLVCRYYPSGNVMGRRIIPGESSNSRS
ncbi:MAG: CAP family protein [Pseudomonadota bacterium]